MDPWYSMGSGDMLEVAHMAVHVGQMGGIAEKDQLFDAVTVNSARTMGLEGYGLAVGCKANLVILQAADVTEAIRLKPTRLYVLREGRVISRTAPRLAELSLAGRPAQIDPGLNYLPPGRG